jgi:hypothetical protein
MAQPEMFVLWMFQFSDSPCFRIDEQVKEQRDLEAGTLSVLHCRVQIIACRYKYY